jgi:hypothetical protein
MGSIHLIISTFVHYDQLDCKLKVNLLFSTLMTIPLEVIVTWAIWNLPFWYKPISGTTISLDPMGYILIFFVAFVLSRFLILHCRLNSWKASSSSNELNLGGHVFSQPNRDTSGDGASSPGP